MALAGGLPLATSVATHKLADSESLEVMVACYNEICGQGVFFFFFTCKHQLLVEMRNFTVGHMHSSGSSV